MIAALILAAGQSKRMGKPKMSLRWGKTTVLGQVIATLQTAGVEKIVIVTGSAREQVETLIAQRRKEAPQWQEALFTIFNEQYTSGEMLSSVQVGLKTLSEDAALIAPGDHPLVQIKSIQLIIQEYYRTGSSLIVPSFQMQRGHPWLVARFHWDEIIQMSPPETLRDFLNRHAREIHYIEVDDPGILQDLDTPEDYTKSQPAS